jgi:hypothetical protein
MGFVSNVTKKIAGVEKSRDAGVDSEVRQLLRDNALVEDDPELAMRYSICAECEFLKEEFKLLGITVKDMTPACAECGCNMLLKIPMKSQSCAIGKW